MVEVSEKAREDFFSEAQEIIEVLSRNLLTIDELQRHGSSDPSLINEAFRSVHTLKGLSSLFGAPTMGGLAHHLEDVLDDLRLGRVDFDNTVLDLLFRAVELFTKVLAIEKAGGVQPTAAVDELIDQIRRMGATPGPSADDQVNYELDPGILSVLTEYEEHRLRSNIEGGLRLFKLRVRFELATIDRALEEIKEQARKLGEIITYLPTGESGGIETIELDLLMASGHDLGTLVGALGGDNVIIEEVPRRRAGGVSVAPRPMARTAEHHPTGQAPDLVPFEATLAMPNEQLASLRSVSQTVRVDIRKLDHLMNIVGELAIVRGAIARMAERLHNDGHRQVGTELMRLHRNFDRRLEEMQDGIIEVRMVPLGQVFDRLARVVRQISHDVGKDIRLVITGAETEIDKLIVEELSDPLMHMIRNSIDHGIESASERDAVGKPLTGTIALNAFQKGNHVMLEVEDDGRGVDEKAVLERAVRLGKVSPDEVDQLTRAEILNLIFLPGVSTRDSVDDLSGRGVGMDIVKTNISKLGGVIDVHSEFGIGTKTTITLPITLAIVSALMFRVAGNTFAIPLASVSEAIAFDSAGVRQVDGRDVISLRGTTLPICRLDELLGIERSAPHPNRSFAVVASLGTRRLGLVVDQLLGQQDIVIKPLGKLLRDVRGFAGATELGDQHVGMVLDAASLIDEVLVSSDIGLRSGKAGHG